MSKKNSSPINSSSRPTKVGQEEVNNEQELLEQSLFKRRSRSQKKESKPTAMIVNGLNITAYYNNVHIEDSYLMKNPFEMRQTLNEVRKLTEKYHYTVLEERSNCSLIREWIAHNNAYTIGYKRERTGSVDLNFPQKWYVKVLYFFLSLFIL